MLKKPLAMAAFLSCQLLSSSLLAQSSESLPNIVVSASRMAESADETLASVSVISRQDIQRMQAQSVSDVLRGTLGIQIANNGGAGKNSSVFMRGTESDHILVLIDGVKVGSATLGQAALQNLPVDLIEKIEIVRGPRSSLYGSEAIGGVIHIFTRKGGGEFKANARLSVGSDHTFKGSAGISGGGENGWYQLSASGMDTDGFNSCNGDPTGGGCFTFEPDDDAYQEKAISLRAGYRISEQLEVDFHAIRSDGENEYDGSFVNESDTVQQIFGLGVKYEPLDAWQAKIKLGYTEDESDDYLNGTFTSRFVTDRNSISWQNDIFISDQQILVLGLDYQDDKVSATTNYAVTSRDNKGVFAQYQTDIDRHNIQLSLRHDDNEQFGGHTTGGLAWGYRFNNDYRLSASYATAFKAPTFNELYFPFFGNSTLEPEKSRSFEIGIKGKSSNLNWGFSAFDTRIDDLISYDASISAPGNVDKSHLQGLEARLRINSGALSSNIQLTLPIKYQIDSGFFKGNDLPRRPGSTLRVDIDYAINKWLLGMTVLANGKAFDDMANSLPINGYAIVDLRTEYRLNKNWNFQARLENLFDKDYETAAYYNQPGRGLFVTMAYQL